MSGEQSRGEGSSTITGSEGSISTETRRNDGRSVTSIEGSGGGQGVSVSGEGPGRTTIAQSGSGDLYAGHDGNVYKKTDSGWQHYEDGNWSPVDSARGESYRQMGPDAASPTGSGTQQRPANSVARQQPAGGSWQTQPRDTRSPSQLDRDYAARQRGNQQYRQRSGGMSRGMGRRR
jgi:hypothetical protein